MAEGSLARVRQLAGRLARAAALPFSAQAWAVPLGGRSVAVAVDRVDGHPLPVLRVTGWADWGGEVDIWAELADGRRIGPDACYRVERPDVRQAGYRDTSHPGFIAEFMLDGEPARFGLFGREMEVPSARSYGTLRPHYEPLLTTDQVFGRDGIYGVGPPGDVSPEVEALAMGLPGRVLDFGCGNGDLVAKLRRQGRDCHGVELDNDRIRSALRPEARGHVTLYPGGLPLPFADGAFTSVFASEVLEHIPDAGSLVPELARVATDRLLVTVPDMTCIPYAFPTGMVPWHLLEGTHVNFFNHRSLTRMLSSHFRPVRLLRLGGTYVNGHYVPWSLGAEFVKN